MSELVETRNIKKSNKLKNSASVKIFLFLMLVFPVLNWLVFWLYVNINGMILAFQTHDGHFTFLNFQRFFLELSSGGKIFVALKNTLIYFSVSVFIILPLSLIISYFIFKRILGYKIFRVVFYLPGIISAVVMVKVFTEFISPLGPLGFVLKKMGIPIPLDGLLGMDATATPTIVFYTVWTGLGGNILLLGGAMSRIPDSVLEAGKLDGIKPMRELFNVILPMVWPTLSTMLIFTFTGIFTASGPILLFKPTGENQTCTLALWIFLEVFGGGVVGGSGSYNLVSAVGLFFTMIGVPIILLVRAIIEKIPSVEF